MQNVASLRVLLTRAFPLNIALEASHLLSLDTWRALHHTAFSEHHRLSSESQTKGLQLSGAHNSMFPQTSAERRQYTIEIIEISFCSGTRWQDKTEAHGIVTFSASQSRSLTRQAF